MLSQLSAEGMISDSSSIESDSPCPNRVRQPMSFQNRKPYTTCTSNKISFRLSQENPSRSVDYQLAGSSVQFAVKLAIYFPGGLSRNLGIMPGQHRILGHVCTQADEYLIGTIPRIPSCGVYMGTERQRSSDGTVILESALRRTIHFIGSRLIYPLFCSQPMLAFGQDAVIHPHGFPRSVCGRRYCVMPGQVGIACWSKFITLHLTLNVPCYVQSAALAGGDV